MANFDPLKYISIFPKNSEKSKENISKNRMTAKESMSDDREMLNKKDIPVFKANVIYKMSESNDAIHPRIASACHGKTEWIAKDLKQDFSKEIESLKKLHKEKDISSIKKLCMQKYGSEIGLQKYNNLTKPDFSRKQSYIK